ncbi:hypothetical protein LINPERPRIM_LOCUS15390 [Linum perenne]
MSVLEIEGCRIGCCGFWRRNAYCRFWVVGKREGESGEYNGM